MKLGLVTDCLGNLPFEKMLDVCVALGVEQVELGCGNWSSAPHIDLDGLLESETRRDTLKGMLKDRNLSISAFNCSGNPLAPGDWGKANDEVIRKTYRLSEYFGLHKVVSMSGLPGGGPEDKFPNWVVTSWPPETQTILQYQWSVAVPYWRENVKQARAHGVTQIALEPHGSQLVHNVENFLRLREEVNDEAIGFNLDPSHLFWMGADPLRVARALKDAIYHVHIKDTRIEPAMAETNTLLDTKEVLRYAERSWNFAIPGFGHDARWWREFLVTLHMAGYQGVLSIEHEDYTMDVTTALQKTTGLLKREML